MKRSKKIKLLTSLSSFAVLATSIPVVATSCTVVPNTNKYGPDHSAAVININDIKWNIKDNYNFYTEAGIVAIIKQDNKEIFDYYPGLEDAINISANCDATTKKIAVTIKAIKNSSRYIETNDVKWNATYVGVEPIPTGNIVVDVSNIESKIYTSSSSYTKSFEIFAALNKSSSMEQINIADVQVSLSGNGITAASGSASDNKGYVNVTVGTTVGVARLIVTVTDTYGNVGFAEAVITVKRQWETINCSDFLTFESGFSDYDSQLKIDRENKRIYGYITPSGTMTLNTDIKLATLKAGYDETTKGGMRQGGMVGGYSDPGVWWTHYWNSSSYIYLNLPTTPSVTKTGPILYIDLIYAFN